MSKLNILVVGLGGIGSIYSFLLRRARSSSQSVHLSFVARSNYGVIKDSGIAIQSAKFGNHKVMPDALYRTTEEAGGAGVTYDYIICTTKSLPNQSTAALLRPVVTTSQSTIVLIQNGLGIERPIHEAFPDNTVLSCTAYIGVWQSAPGIIEHSALERLEVGTYPDRATLETTSSSSAATVERERAEKDSVAIETFKNLLVDGGSDVSIVPSMVGARWKKLIWNASFNCVCTVTQLDTFQITSSPPAKSLVMDAMHEIISVANAAGHEMPLSLVETNWENTKKMGVAYKPSMLLDFLAHRAMEIDVILGGPIREAERLDVNVPTLKSLKRILDVLDWNIQHPPS